MFKPETLEKIKAAIDLYAHKGRLADVLSSLGLSHESFFKARNEVPSIELAYLRARKQRADLLADEITSISDDETNPHRARIRIDARRWVCGVFNRQVYGDHIDMTVEGRIDLSAALNAARARVTDKPQTEELQDAEYAMLPAGGTTDNKSDDPENAADVDPFEE